METTGRDLWYLGRDKHGSYLQGMETDLSQAFHQLYIGHGSYLQGMETDTGEWEKRLEQIGTDPTYKEWKLTVE